MKHIFLALTNPVAGNESSFNKWYDEQHLREVLDNFRGFLGGRRYRLNEHQRPGQPVPPWQYLALYDFECANLAEYHRAPRKPGAKDLTPFDHLVKPDYTAWIYTPIGSRFKKLDRGGLSVVHPASREEAVGQSPTRHLFFALTNADAGREVEFNEWYDRYHLREVLTYLPEFVRGQRYVLAPDQRPQQPAPQWKYIAIYEVESNNCAAIHPDVQRIFRERRPTPAPEGALKSDHVAWLFSPLGEYVR